VTRERDEFYTATVAALVDRGVLGRDMRLLVAAGGKADRDVLHSFGFSNVTISNMVDAAHDAYVPYGYEVQDLEALDYDDGAVDWAIVSAGLHHCRSPHRALLELYRVVRRGVLALESRDCAALRLAVRLGAIDAYELTAVAAHDFRGGGVRGTDVPNYVYRWTEREVEKTIASYAPEARHRFMYFHALELPLSIFDVDARRRRLGGLLRAGHPLLRRFARVVPSQANLFAFAVIKPQLPRDLQPWLTMENGRVTADESWIRRRLRV
jgi:SAM-dependent methyltransferase